MSNAYSNILIPINDLIRENEKDLLIQYCNEYENFLKLDDDVKEALIDEIELGCYNETVKFYLKNIHFNEYLILHQYEELISKLKKFIDLNSSINIQSPNSRKVLDMCINFILKENLDISINPLDLATVEEVDVYSERFEEIINIINIKNNQTVEERTTKLYPCPICRVRDATYKKQQDRSFDEGESLHLKCAKCGKKWRIRG